MRASRRSWSALLIGGLLASGAAVGLPASAAPTVTVPKVIIVPGAIHGIERTGVEAQLSLLQRLSTGSPAMKEILDGVTLVSIPMLNPDGLELNRRVNDISWADTLREFPQLRGAPSAWYYRAGSSTTGPGYDLNRDFPRIWTTFLSQETFRAPRRGRASTSMPSLRRCAISASTCRASSVGSMPSSICTT